MKTSNRWSYRAIVGKIMMGLVAATMIGSAYVVPARGDDAHYRGERRDNGRYENRGRGHDRDHHVRARRVYRPDRYRERVYVPPRVIYEPPSPPGISIFFPPIIIRP